MEKFIFVNSNAEDSPATISVENFKALEECCSIMIESLDMSIEMLSLYKQNMQEYMRLMHLKYGSIAGAPQNIRDNISEMVYEIVSIGDRLADKKLLDLLNKK